MVFLVLIHEVLNFRASELIGLIMKSAKFFITGTQLMFKQYTGLI